MTAAERYYIVKPWVKVFLVTITLAVPAMLFGRVTLAPAEGGPDPTAGQLPFFIFLAACEAIALGLGVYFLAFGLAPMRRAAGGSTLWAWLMYPSGGCSSPGGPTTTCTSITATTFRVFCT